MVRRKNISDRVIVINSATWNENSYISFVSGMGSGSRVDTEQEINDKVKAPKIDSVL